MSYLTQVQKDTDRLLRDIGGEMTLRSTAKGVYDPATGAPATSVATTQTVIATVIEYSSEEKVNTDIIRGDRKAIISTKRSNGLAVTAPVEGDQLEGIGDNVRVVGVRPIVIDRQAVVYICQVRE